MNPEQLRQFFLAGQRAQAAVDVGKCPFCETHNAASSVVIKCGNCERIFPRAGAPSKPGDDGMPAPPLKQAGEGS